MTTTDAATSPFTRRCSISTVRPADPRLAAVLDAKPPADEVPIEAWWHLADSLQHSVSVRRAREGVEILNADELRREISTARWSAQAALIHLGPGSRTRSTGTRAERVSVRTSIRDLARLIVSARITSTDILRAAVLSHLDALAAPQR